MTRTEPAVRVDGKCAVCRKRRTIPTTSYASRAQHEADPFCSRRCCHRWYGIEVSTLTGRAERAAA